MSLETRIRRLERQNNWMRRILGGGLAVAALVLLSGQGKAEQPKDIVVRSLVVQDSGGKPRIALRTNFGKNSKYPHVAILDDAGDPRAVLSLLDHEIPKLVLRDAKKRRTVEVHGGGSFAGPSIELTQYGDGWKSSKLRLAGTAYVEGKFMSGERFKLPR